jgi:hypothetical protein
MTTGNYWDVTVPTKPVGIFDPDGVYDIPFDWVTWLAGLTDTYASHTITAAAGLDVVTSQEIAGVIIVRVREDPLVPLVVGQKYGLTCHIVTTSGQEEDQTVYFKVKEK